MYIGGDMICSFLTNDNICQYITKMRNNLTTYSIAIGEENIYFLTPHFKFIKRDRIVDSELLNTTKTPLIHLIIIVKNTRLKKCKKINFR